MSSNLPQSEGPMAGQDKTDRHPEVSVLMGIHNERYPGAIRRAVDSILGQSLSDLELIIYDDGSDPAISDLIGTLAGSDSRIQIIGATQQQGLAHSLNACLKHASAPFIARMDADDVALPDRLARELSYLRTHPETAWVGCNARIYDQNGEWGHASRPAEPALRNYLRYSPFIHPTVMIRRKVLEQAGGYDTGERSALLEDYELFLRLYRNGLRGDNLQEELLLYYTDRTHYHTRGLRQRVKEMKLRSACYRELKIRLSIGWLYVIRPLAGALIPGRLLRRIKSARHQL